MSLRNAALALPLIFVACARSGSVPDPKVAAEEYAAAAERGDAEAIYGMMTKRSRATMSLAEVQKTVSGSRVELADQAKEIRKASGSIVAVAQIYYPDGMQVSLTLEKGRFWIATAGFTVGGGSTPEEALGSFHDALKRRSYPALIRLLSPKLRAEVEAQLRGLAEALDSPGAKSLPPASGDDLEVKLQNGHRIRLHRENGVWYVQNFE